MDYKDDMDIITVMYENHLEIEKAYTIFSENPSYKILHSYIKDSSYCFNKIIELASKKGQDEIYPFFCCCMNLKMIFDHFLMQIAHEEKFYWELYKKYNLNIKNINNDKHIFNATNIILLNNKLLLSLNGEDECLPAEPYLKRNFEEQCVLTEILTRKNVFKTNNISLPPVFLDFLDELENVCFKLKNQQQVPQNLMYLEKLFNNFGPIIEFLESFDVEN